MEKDDVLLVEEFVIKTEQRLSVLIDSIDVMTLTKEQNELFRRSTKIIRNKMEDIKNADSKSELKKVFKLKKYLGDNDE